MRASHQMARRSVLIVNELWYEMRLQVVLETWRFCLRTSTDVIDVYWNVVEASHLADRSAVKPTTQPRESRRSILWDVGCSGVVYLYAGRSQSVRIVILPSLNHDNLNDVILIVIKMGRFFSKEIVWFKSQLMALNFDFFNTKY